MEANVFTASEKDQIRTAIRQKYTQVSLSAAGKFKYLTGKEGALALQYDEHILAEMPEKLMDSFCGVGNPFSLGQIHKAAAVLDVGCGAGFDLIVASKLAGPSARICGIDLTEEMVNRAQDVVDEVALQNIEIKKVDSEKIPYGDNSFDVVSSNGVINLSPAKLELFEEIYRVLKPGGRLQFADMVLDKRLPPGMAGNLEAWSQ